MNTISIHTAQNVTIEYEIGSLGHRVLAAIIDGTFQLAYILILIWFFEVFDRIDAAAYEWLVVVYYLGIFLPLALYHPLCEALFNGQSFGKMLMQLKVVKLDGTPLSLGSIVLRWLLRLIDVGISSGSIAILTVILNGRGQRLGDIAAGTTVVSVRPQAQFDDTLFELVQDSYEVRYPEVGQLSDRDMGIIKETFDEANRRGNHELMVRLSEKIQAVTGIRAEQSHADFVQTVIKDYNALHG